MLRRLMVSARSLWRGMRGRPAFEREMDEEFASHLALRADDLVRNGMARDAAIRQARLEFGLPEEHKHRARASRGLTGVDRAIVSWLDFKLGARMLVRYPALTLVAGVAIAFGIATGLATFSFVGQVLYPALPLADGERVIGIRLWSDASRDRPFAPADFDAWQRDLGMVEDLGAFRTFRQNLQRAGEPFGSPVAVAAMHASGFRLARVAPFLGRTLTREDERPGAPPVAVISFDAWQSRLAGDSSAVNGPVSIGGTTYTLVGVMPRDFAFPIFHDAWVPLVADVRTVETPSLYRAFARLKDGHTIEAVNTRLASIHARRTAEVSDSLRKLVPQAGPYARSIFDLSSLESRFMLGLNVAALMFLLVVSGNVAMLMFARATARENEIVVRRALGATTSRIVMQLVSEALVLGGLAALLGVTAARLVVRQLFAVIAVGEGTPPFWITDATTPATYAYAVALTLIVAGVTGAVPALKVLRGMASQLRAHSSGGGGVHFGGIWTAVVVAQVAVTVAFPASTFFVLRDRAQIEAVDPGFAASEYLGVRFFAEPETPDGSPTTRGAFESRIGRSLLTIEERLAAEPGVVATSLTDYLPHTGHPNKRIEVDAGGAAPADSASGHRVNVANVDVGWFGALGASVQGRGFSTADRDAPAASQGRAVVVNASFVRHVLGGRQAVGRRVRYVVERRGGGIDSTGPWHEIAGVVKDLAVTEGSDPSETGAGIYHAMTPGSVLPVFLVLHARGGSPSALADRVRAVATQVDPSIRIELAIPLDRVNDVDLRWIMLWFWVLAIASGLTMLLSLAGIYSVLSFTVSRRTREIGIRVALGSDPRRVTLALLSRPLAQVGLGVAVGAVLVGLLSFSILGRLTPVEVALVIGYALGMLVVCLAAGLLPVRRALRIQPTEALRADV